MNVQSVLVSAAHSSGQFSDTVAQQERDAGRIAHRMAVRGHRWTTGTEAGKKSNLGNAFRRIAPANNQTFFKANPGEVWILVDNDFFRPGSLEMEWYKVIPGFKREYPDRGVLRVTGESPVVKGVVTILASHYNTKGSMERAGTQGANEKIARQVKSLAREYGAGRNLVFYGGDQNLQDRFVDTFFDGPLTSLADEVGPHQNTGHGEIDVMASYNGDVRVSGVSWNVLNDREFPLSTDHFYCEGEWRVRIPKFIKH